MKEEKPNYYAVIPAKVRYDEKIKDKAKLLYGEITSLCDENGYCYATNKYFANLYKVKPETISRLINSLVEAKYLSSEIDYKTGAKNRCLKIENSSIDQNINTLLTKKSLPILINNNKEKELYSNKLEYSKKKKKSIINIPSISEIEDYCVNVRHNNIDFKYFYDFYNEANWIDSNGKQIKNWKQKIIQWEHHNKDTKVVPEYERF